jgi:hypothetical protein
MQVPSHPSGAEDGSLKGGHLKTLMGSSCSASLSGLAVWRRSSTVLHKPVAVYNDKRRQARGQWTCPCEMTLEHPHRLLNVAEIFIGWGRKTPDGRRPK